MPLEDQDTLFTSGNFTISGVNPEGDAINVNIESHPLMAIANALDRIADALEKNG